MTKTPKPPSQAAPMPGAPLGDTVQFQQRVLRDTASRFSRTTKDKSLRWQAMLGPGWQLSAAMELWLTLEPESRLSLCLGYLDFQPFPEAKKAEIRAAVARAVQGEAPPKSGG